MNYYYCPCCKCNYLFPVSYCVHFGKSHGFFAKKCCEYIHRVHGTYKYKCIDFGTHCPPMQGYDLNSENSYPDCNACE